MSDTAEKLKKTNNVIEDGSLDTVKKEQKKTTPKRKIIQSPKPKSTIEPSKKFGGASVVQNDFSVLSFIGVSTSPNIILTAMSKEEQVSTEDNSKNGTSQNKDPETPVGESTNITKSPVKESKKPMSTSSIDSAIDGIESKKPKKEPYQEIELSDTSEINRDFNKEDSGIFGDIFGGGSGGSSGGSSGGDPKKSDESKEFFTSFGAEFKRRSNGDKSPTKIAQKPSNDPNLGVPEKINDAPILDTKVEKFILNNSARSLFRKCYSVFNQLTPFIKCFIRAGKDDNSKKFDVSLLDIPYNFIKSLEVNYETGSAVTGTINLKIEDAGGSVGLFLMSKLWSLGLTSGDMNGVPKIIIQFGWAPNGRQKIKKNTKIYTSNFFTEYFIEDVEMDYGQNFSQEITIKARQEKTSIDGFLRDRNSPDTPFKILTEFPLKILKAKEYAFYFKSQVILDPLLKKFGFMKSEKDQAEKTIKKFLDEGYKDITVSSTFDLLNINPIFNCFKVNNLDKSNSDFINLFNGPIGKSSFTPYFALYYFLNQYMKVIKDAKEKINELKIPLMIQVLDFYDKSKVDKYGKNGKTIILDEKDYYKLVEKDINAVKSKTPQNSSKLIDTNFQITADDTWEALLERVANLVHYEKDPTTRLSVSINYFPLDVALRAQQFKDNNIFSGSAELNKLKSFDNLINRLDQLVEAYKKLSKEETEKPSGKRVTDLKTEGFEENIKKIKEKLTKNPQSSDLILIIISAGSRFLIQDNMKDALVLQKYTVFPKIKPTFELKHQNFNSGSRRMIDESFPDVIDFKPKINFKNILTSHFARFDIVNFKNGVVEITSESEIKISEDISANEITKKLEEAVKAFEDFLNQPSTPSTSAKTLVFEEKKVFETTYYCLKDNRSVIFTANLFNDKKTFKNTIDDKTAIKVIHQKLTKVLGDVRSNTIYANQNNLFRKAIKVTPGYNQIVDFHGYESLANQYMNDLKASAYDFEAELTILGEPAFTFDYGLSVNHIYLEVNNPNGQKNPFLTGRYYVMKMKHTIQGSKFLTILSLKYDSPVKSDTTNTTI